MALTPISNHYKGCLLQELFLFHVEWINVVSQHQWNAGVKNLLASVISGGNYSINDVVVEVRNSVPGPIAVPVLSIKVLEEHDAGTNLEPEHLGQKARRVEMINEFKRIYVLLMQHEVVCCL